MAVTMRGMYWRSVLVALAAGLVLARLGPFDTFSQLPPFERAAYWVGLTLLLALQILVALHLLTPPLQRLHWIWAATLSGVLGAVPSAFEVAWAESLLRVERDLGLVDLLAVYGDVTLVAIPLAIAMRAVMPVPDPPALDTPAGDPDRLVASMSPARRGELLALKAEDHYLRIYTTNGEELVLRRFRDALADVARSDGLQVHRGWWVARAAIDRVERDGDGRTLILVNGARVPVSRTYALAARAAGLFE